MKVLRWCLVIASMVYQVAISAETLEVTIHGMTCAFCVDGLQRNLVKLPGVERADVSLKHKKARIRMKPGVSPDIADIKQAVIDAGFTPLGVTVIPDAQ